MAARSPSRQKARPAPKATVQDWILALETAGRVWRAAEAEDPRSASADPPGDLQKLRAWGLQLTAEGFPGAAPGGVSALVAGAWLNAVRALTHAAAGPEARTACAPLLREATEAVERLLTLHRTSQADRWRGRYGDA